MTPTERQLAKDSRENVAANAVVTQLAAVLGIAMTARKWDDGSQDRMHDFYIEGDGHKIALEVTTIADSQRVSRDASWSEEAPDGWVEVDGLTGCWTAYYETPRKRQEPRKRRKPRHHPSDVVRAIRDHLPRLETLGVTRVDASWQEHLFTPDTRPLGYEQSGALNLVGIVWANRVTDASDALLDDHAGEVQVLRGCRFDRPADRNFPTTVINEQLRDLHRSDVQKLLAVKDATARHLWMWVELTEGLAMIRSFETEGFPDVGLDAEGIDGVWLGRSPAPDVIAGHVWLRELGWSEFSVARNEVIAG